MLSTAYLAAFGGGVVSFVSPCVLPLVPVYLSLTTGVGVSDLQDRDRRPFLPVLRGAGLFVAGFATVFVALGLSATALGSTLSRHQVPLTRAGGLLVVAMGLFLLLGTSRSVSRGSLGFREIRFHPVPGRWGPWAAPIIGAAFGFGWTPCIGPVLGSVLTVAAGQDRVFEGGLLLAAYSAGLGLPFLATGLAWHRGMVALRWTRRHSVQVVRASAVLLTAYGLLLVADRLSWVTLHVQQAVIAVGLDGLVTVG